MEQRLKNLKRMHNVISKLGKDVYEDWISFLSREPDEEGFKEIADDIDEYDDCVSKFVYLVHAYM